MNVTAALRIGNLMARLNSRLAGPVIARRAFVALLVLSGIGSAQDVTEPALKAAYIYNFALFTEWPSVQAATGTPFTICVRGDAAISDALERDTKTRTVAGRTIKVLRAPQDSAQRGCHILYLAGLTPVQTTQAVTGLGDAPVLTLSDMDGFTERGGIAQFYFEHGQLKFQVENATAKRAHLQISARLLALAKHK
jgi:hypothetical protein